VAVVCIGAGIVLMPGRYTSGPGNWGMLASPFLLADLPLSFGLDTLPLPYTIPDAALAEHPEPQMPVPPKEPGQDPD
jgi:hypothetical protein